MGLLQPVGYADIPSEISGKSFGEQLEILRNMFGIITGSGPATEGLSQIGGKKLQFVLLNEKVGVFIEDMGLLCFDGEYFVEDVWPIQPIKLSTEETIFGFSVTNSKKGYSIFVHNNTAMPKKFSRQGIEFFESPEIAYNNLITSLKVGEALNKQNTLH